MRPISGQSRTCQFGIEGIGIGEGAAVEAQIEQVLALAPQQVQAAAE
jgi:hypothetical protein